MLVLRQRAGTASGFGVRFEDNYRDAAIEAAFAPGPLNTNGNDSLRHHVCI
jgi:hypothetical protein